MRGWLGKEDPTDHCLNANQKQGQPRAFFTWTANQNIRFILLLKRQNIYLKHRIPFGASLQHIFVFV
eukprot:scaffold2143_cov125-Cylindrotheca_fusiformis.AAC.22